MGLALCGNQILRRVRAELNPGSQWLLTDQLMSFAVCARLNWGQRGRACDVCGRETQRVAKNRGNSYFFTSYFFTSYFFTSYFFTYTLLCLELGRLGTLPRGLVTEPYNNYLSTPCTSAAVR